MKVIIWTLTFFVGAFVNILIGNALGIRAGALLLFIGEYFIARKLCEKWDDHLAQKASRKREMANESSNVVTTSDNSKPVVDDNHSENDTIPERVLPEKNAIRNENIAKLTIDSKYGPIVFYSDASSTNKVPIHYIGFCPQCGAAYGKDSVCCDKCGATIGQR